jgi:hypothetical protein
MMDNRVRSVSPTSAVLLAAVTLIVMGTAQADGQEVWRDRAAAGMGIGIGTSVGGTGGLMVHRYFSDSFGIQGILGLTNFSIKGQTAGATEAERSASNITLGGYAIKRVRDWEGGSFNWLAGLEVSFLGGKAENTFSDFDASSTDITLGAGIMADHFLSDRVALVLQTGISYTMLGENSVRAIAFGGTGDLSGSRVRVGQASMGGMLGITWWP